MPSVLQPFHLELSACWTLTVPQHCCIHTTLKDTSVYLHLVTLIATNASASSDPTVIYKYCCYYYYYYYYYYYVIITYRFNSAAWGRGTPFPFFFPCPYTYSCFALFTFFFFGRLLQVDLIKWVSNVRSYVHPSVRKSYFDFNEIWYVGRRRWVMHDSMQYDRNTASKVKVTSPWKP